MGCPQFWLNGAIFMEQNKEPWPLMVNNVEREDLDQLIDYLQQDDPKLTHGPLVAEFEKRWSQWLGVNSSVMVNSGSSANDLTLLALKHLKGGGEVILPPLTWVSDVAAVLHAGFEPVFVDIDLSNLAMDTELTLERVNSKTKAVFLTHVLGLDGLSDTLLEGLQNKGVSLIEDVCESHGATHKESKCGSLGWVSNFSFYYAHHMTTIEGGIISTNDEDLHQLIRMLRSHGLVREVNNSIKRDQLIKENPELNPEFIFSYPSHNMRPIELQGILGLSQLNRLDKNNDLRSKNFKYFLSLLDAEKFYTDFKTEGSSNYALIVMLRENNEVLRSSVEKILSENLIEYRRGLSGGGNQLRQPYLKRFSNKFDLADFPNIEHVHFNAWYIGNYPGLQKEKIELLSSLLNSI